MPSVFMNAPMETRMRFYQEVAAYWRIEDQEMLLRMIDGDSAWEAARNVRGQTADSKTQETYFYHARRIEDFFREWLGRGTDLDILRRDGIVRGLTRPRARNLIEQAEKEGIVAKMDVIVYRVE